MIGKISIVGIICGVLYITHTKLVSIRRALRTRNRNRNLNGTIHTNNDNDNENANTNIYINPENEENSNDEVIDAIRERNDKLLKKKLREFAFYRFMFNKFSHLWRHKEENLAISTKYITFIDTAILYRNTYAIITIENIFPIDYKTPYVLFASLETFNRKVIEHILNRSSWSLNNFYTPEILKNYGLTSDIFESTITKVLISRHCPYEFLEFVFSSDLNLVKLFNELYTRSWTVFQYFNNHNLVSRNLNAIAFYNLVTGAEVFETGVGYGHDYDVMFNTLLEIFSNLSTDHRYAIFSRLFTLLNRYGNIITSPEYPFDEKNSVYTHITVLINNLETKDTALNIDMFLEMIEKSEYINNKLLEFAIKKENFNVGVLMDPYKIMIKKLYYQKERVNDRIYGYEKCIDFLKTMVATN